MSQTLSRRSTRTAVALVTSIVLATGIAGPAIASPARPDAPFRTSAWPYAIEVAALHGQTLAQYIDAHEQHRLLTLGF